MPAMLALLGAVPWAMETNSLRELFSRGFALQALHAIDAEQLQNTRATSIRDGVAIIPVTGPLMRGEWARWFGGTSYQDVRKDLQAALESAGVKAILLDVNSPGGEVDGCAELADAIYAARGVKPIETYAGGLLASAAEWIGSATSRTTCAETAIVGSVGVRSALIDFSELENKIGVRVIEIIASQSPNKRDRPIDDAVKARAQQVVDDLADTFVRAMARNRGVDEAHVLEHFGQGGVMVGRRALKAGLVDEIGNLEAVIARLAGRDNNAGAIAAATSSPATSSAPTNERETTMSIKAKPRAEEEKKPEGEDKKDKPESAEDEEKKPDAEGEDCDDDDEKKEDEEEKAAHAALAAKVGLPATASRKEVLLAATIGTVHAAQIGSLVDKRVQAALADEKKQRAAAEAKTRAEALAEEAVLGGYAESDRSALVAFATGNFEAAEKLVAPFLAKSRQLFGRMTAGGAPIGAARGSDVAPAESASGVVKMGRPLAAAIRDFRAANPKVSYEEAALAVAKKHPELAAQYLSGQ
jgi:signal peptide peptidase SppA